MSCADLDVSLALVSDAEAARPILNLYPLYLSEIAAYEVRAPNRHGLPSDDDDVRSWNQILDGLAPWWAKPGVLFPYLVRVGGRAAGFSLIGSGGYVPTEGVDFVVHEFFVDRHWRGTGVAAEAARASIERHRGEYEVATWPTATRAIAFWRRTLPSCARGDVRERREDHAWGPRVVFRFENRGD